ncbi:hypothetical protein ABI125_08645 [Tamlana crocina]
MKKMNGNGQININQTIVEIFKTDVNSEPLANEIVCGLNKLYPDCLISFDLEDCDKVLRIESNNSIDVFGVINYGKCNNIEISLIDY